MNDLAINDEGATVYFDGKDWKPAAVAANEAGDRVAYDGKQWRSVPAPEPPKPLGERIASGVNEASEATYDFVKRSKEYLQTQATKTLAGVAGTPRATADIVKRGAEALGVPKEYSGLAAIPVLGPLGIFADRMPTGEDIERHLLSGAKKANPEFEPRSIHPIVDAGVQAAMAGPLFGVNSKVGAVYNALGGMGQEAAGEVTHEVAPDYENLIRAAGAVVPVAGAAGIEALARKGFQAGNAFLEPFRKEGIEAIKGRAITKMASNPEAAADTLDKYIAERNYAGIMGNEAAPNFGVNAGLASRDPGLMQGAEVAAANNSAMRGQFNTNNIEVTKALDTLLKNLPNHEEAGTVIQKALADRFGKLMTARSKASDPLYEATRNSTAIVDPTDAWVFAAQKAEENKGVPRELMEKVQGFLEEKDANTARGLVATRNALQALDTPQLDNYSKSLLQGVRQRIDTALDAVPEAKQARDTFAAHSKPLEPFAGEGNEVVANVIDKGRYGKDFTTPPETVPAKFFRGGDLSAPRMRQFLDANGDDAAGLAAMRSHVINDFRAATSASVSQDAAGNPRMLANGAARWLEKNDAGAKLAMTDDQMRALNEISDKLGIQAQTVPGRVGSPTYDRLATDNILGALMTPKLASSPIFYGLNKTLGLVYGGANETIKNQLFEVLADPVATRALMRPINKTNVKLAEGTVSKLLRSSAAAMSVNADNQ